MLVAPSILSADFSKLKEEINSIESCDMIHIDVMDGMFVPNISFGGCVIKSIRNCTKKPFDTHLMINEPIRYIKDFYEAGSDYITIHLEACSDALETIKEIKKYCKAGISIKPKTDILDIVKYLDIVDLVLIMTVEPGFGGQSFMPDMVSKIDFLREYKNKNNSSFIISVDGGISDKTIAKVKNADMVVAGSYVFKGENRKERIDSLK